MESIPMNRDDEFLHIQAGGGGFGNPLERDPQKILNDAMNELITIEYALDVYGVVIRDEAIDLEATEIRRTEMIEKGDIQGAYLTHFHQTIGVDPSARGKH
jgi:N-methylhydantoinase B